MITVPHVTSGLGLRKFQADGFLLTRAYTTGLRGVTFGVVCTRRCSDLFGRFSVRSTHSLEYGYVLISFGNVIISTEIKFYTGTVRL